MSKQVIKGWVLDESDVGKLKMEWMVLDHMRTATYLKNPNFPTIYKLKGTKKEAEECDYPWPQKKVTITIEVEE